MGYMNSTHDEVTFHDAWARSEDLSTIKIRQSFEGILAIENQFILKEMGDIRSKSILDIGSGLGEASIYFALQGAHVTAVDVSNEMLALVSQSGQALGVTVKTQQILPQEPLPFSDLSFDFVYIANTIHHVKDRSRLYQDIVVPSHTPDPSI